MAQGTPRSQQFFNKHILDRSDPGQARGSYLGGFSFSDIYPLVGGAGQAHGVADQVYDAILKKADQIRQGRPAGTVTVKRIAYTDRKHSHVEGSRDYIEVELETPRKTKATVQIRCLPDNNGVYLAVDSYALGSLNVQTLLRRLGASLPVIAFLFAAYMCVLLANSTAVASIRGQAGVGPQLGGIIGQGICCLLPLTFGLSPILILLWRDVLRGYSFHKDLPRAIRETFNHLADDESFNRDDVLVFLKTVLPAVIDSITEVFEKNDIPVARLRDFKQTIYNITNFGMVGAVGDSAFGRLTGAERRTARDE